MALTSAATKEVARKERERLKAQDKYKKDQLEKLRAEQNTDASLGEVGYPLGPHCCASSAVQVMLCVTSCVDAAGKKSRQSIGLLIEASRGLPAFCS